MARRARLVRARLFLRFGATGHGLASLEEYGLRWLGRPRSARWIRHAFCAANAVAYMTGRPPRGFVLELPRGRPLAQPRLTPIPGLALPAVFPFGRDGSAALSLLGRRTFGMRMLAEIAGRRVRDLLRHRLGVSYSTDAAYEPLDRRTAHILLSADTLDRDVTTARNGLVLVLDELAERGPTEEELAREREMARREVEHPHALPSKLIAAACSTLDRTGVLSREALLEGLAATTSGDVRRAAASALRTALLMLPHGAEVPGGRFSAYPVSSPARVAGRRFSRSDGEPPEPGEEERLVVSDDGVMLARGADVRTVLFADCAARIRFDTGVLLWSRDGFNVWVEPAEWKRGASALRTIEAAAVPSENDVDLRARPLPLRRSRPGRGERRLPRAPLGRRRPRARARARS